MSFAQLWNTADAEAIAAVGTAGVAVGNVLRVWGASNITTTAGNSDVVLPPGTTVGQMKRVRFDSKTTADCIIKPVVAGSFWGPVVGSAVATITLDTEGNECLLMWDGSKWMLLAGGVDA